VNLAYSQRNRSAAVRIPLYSASPKANGSSSGAPDPSCNPYLAFSRDPGWPPCTGSEQDPSREPMDKDIYDLPPRNWPGCHTPPGP